MNPSGEIELAPTDPRKSLLVDSVPLFSGLNPPDLDELLSLAKTAVIKSRQVICCRGEPGDALYVLIAGKLKVTAESGDGRELILAILDAAETFAVIVCHIVVSTQD